MSSSSPPRTHKKAYGEKFAFLLWCQRYQASVNLACAFSVAIFTGVLTVYTVKGWYSSRQQLRAYVDIPRMLLDPLIVDKPVTSELVLKNFGQTPAYKVKYWANAWLSDRIETGYTLTGDGNVAAGHIGPTNEFTVRLDIPSPLTQQEYDGILDGKKSVFFAGRIEYIDAFSERRFIDFKVYYINRNREDMAQPHPLIQAETDNDAD